MAVSGGPDVVTNGLVLALDAGNVKSYPQSGTVWRDLSENGNSGTLTNGPTFSSANGGSIVFDGVNDRVDLGSSNNITGNNIQNFTVSAWIKYSSTSISRAITIQRGASLNSSLFGISVNENETFSGPSIGNLGFFTRNFNNTAAVLLSHNDNYHLKNRYINICCVIEGTNRYLYLDGQLKNSDSGIGMQSVSSNTDTAYLAVGPTGADSVFTGNISSVVIYRKSLTAQEILQNFNSTRSRFGV